MNRFLSLSLLLIAFVILCCDCCTTTFNHPSGRQLAAQEADQTVALIYVNGKNYHTYCSGVFVSNSVLMTANHCIEGITRHINETNEENSTFEGLFPIISPTDITVQFALASEITEVGKPTSALHNATVKALFSGADVALLSIINPNSIKNHGVITMANKAPEQGDDISVIGHPDGFYFSFGRGVVAAIRSDIKYTPKMGPFIQISAPVWKGNSGGCAFNSSGECIGIASFLNGEAPQMSFYIHTDTILSILRGSRILPTTINTLQPDPELTGKLNE